MIPLINHDSQWGRSEVIIIYPDIYIYSTNIYSFGRSSHPQQHWNHPSYMGSCPLNWRVFRKQPPKVQKTKLLQFGVLSQASSQCVLMQWIRGNDVEMEMGGMPRPNGEIKSGWWLTYPSEKWWSSSVGMMMTFPIWWESHKIPWFQITNRLWLSC